MSKLKNLLAQAKMGEGLSLIRRIDKFYTEDFDDKMAVQYWRNVQSIAKRTVQQGKARVAKNAANHAPYAFHPSEIGRCSRAIQFRLLCAPQNPPNLEDCSRVQRIFATGDAYHVRMEAVFGCMGLLTSAEDPFKDEVLGLSGRCDLQLKIPEPVIVELKSISSNGFARLRNGPKDGHTEQLNSYLHYLKRKTGILLYEDKDKQTLKEFKITYDASLFEEARNTFVKIRKALKRKVLLPREGDSFDCFICRYCDYSKFCYNLDNTVAFVESWHEKETCTKSGSKQRKIKHQKKTKKRTTKNRFRVAKKAKSKTRV